jgi:hypothetical protein
MPIDTNKTLGRRHLLKGAAALGALAALQAPGLIEAAGPSLVGDTFHAPYKVTARAGGKIVFMGTGSVTGTRIKPAM